MTQSQPDPERETNQNMEAEPGENGPTGSSAPAQQVAAAQRNPSLFGTWFRILTLRASEQELLGLDIRHLIAGLIATVIVGAGRWWDHQTDLLAHIGLHSFVYVFVLALGLFLIIWPLRPSNWNYVRLLTFITLTAPPAILYAIPVEKFLDPLSAAQANFAMLCTVAIWRVLMLWMFVIKTTELPTERAAIAISFPLTGVVAVLLFVNAMLYDVMEDMMGVVTSQLNRLNRYEGTPADAGTAAAPQPEPPPPPPPFDAKKYTRQIGRPIGNVAAICFPFLFVLYIASIFQAAGEPSKTTASPNKPEELET